MELLDFGFYNLDCMEGMKQFPDKYFDLAIVDPPYGDAKLSDNSWGGGTGERFGGRFDRYRTPSSEAERQTTGRNMGCRELAEDGRRGTIRQKNHSVGRCPRKRVF